MPITFAHPAIVLPLLSKRFKLFSATGLIVGSVIPDFEAFIRFNEHKHYSHTWLGIFWFDLPLAIITAFIFHNIVRDALINNMPEFLENKCKRYIGFRWNDHFRQHFIMVICSMLIGITLHLLWDAFTHLNLADPDAWDSQIYIGRFRLYKVLQDSNSILGMLVVAAYILMLPSPPAPEEVPVAKMMFRIEKEPVKYGKLKYWALLCITYAATVLLAISLLTRQISFVLFIDINITGILVGLIMAGMLCRKW